MSRPRPELSSVLRFDLAIQRNHILVYTLALLTGLAAMALGVFEMRIDIALLAGWLRGLRYGLAAAEVPYDLVSAQG